MNTEDKPADTNAKPGAPLSRRDAFKGLAAVAATAMGAAASAQAAEPGTSPAAGLPQHPYRGKPNTGISLPPYYRPTPSLENANTFFPQAEQLDADH